MAERLSCCWVARFAHLPRFPLSLVFLRSLDLDRDLDLDRFLAMVAVALPLHEPNNREDQDCLLAMGVCVLLRKIAPGRERASCAR